MSGAVHNGTLAVFSVSGEVLVGYDAVAQAEHNPQNTLYDAKRFIGKAFTKQEIITAQKQYPFKVSQFIKHNCKKSRYW